MKRNLLALAIGLGFSASAMAAPISLPEGPLYIKFDNREQIAITGNTGYVDEINWGVLIIRTINVGSVTGVNTIEPTNTEIFNNTVTNNGQITGIFYGIEAAPADPGSAFPGTSGYLDLYWRDLGTYAAVDLPSTTPGVRTSETTATGYTDGDFLVRLMFASGMTGQATTFINGSVTPSSQGFVGIATSFANVDTSAGGLWANSLDTDWFTTAFGTRDMRFRNIYEPLASWGDCSNGICGAFSTDPATAYAVPEPATLALLGMGLLGMGAVARRRKV